MSFIQSFLRRLGNTAIRRFIAGLIQDFIEQFRGYSPSSQRFFYTIIALGFTLDGVYGVLLNLYLLRLGYDARFIGEVNSVGLLTFAIVSLPAGILGTWFTSLRVLRFGAAITFIGMLLLPLGEFVPLAWRDLSYMINYALMLAGFSLYFVNSAPFLMASVEEHQQNAVFAMQNALQAMAGVIGSLFAGNVPLLLVGLFAFSLDKPEPYRYTLLLTSGISLISFLITMSVKAPKKVFQEPKPGSETKLKAVGFTAAVIGLIAIMSAIRFLQVAGLGTVSVYFNVYMDTELGLPPNVLGNVASIARLIAVGAVMLAPRLMHRSSTASVAFWASLATAFALVPIAIVPNWVAASLAYICAIALTNLRFTAFLLYIMTIVPARQQAVMAGAGETAAGFSFALMALGGGYIITEYSFRELFILGFILTGLGSLIFWAYVNRKQSQQVVALETKV